GGPDGAKKDRSPARRRAPSGSARDSTPPDFPANSYRNRPSVLLSAKRADSFRVPRPRNVAAGAAGTGFSRCIGPARVGRPFTAPLSAPPPLAQPPPRPNAPLRMPGVALVTGGPRRLVGAGASALAARAFSVRLVARDPAALEAPAAEIRAAGVRAAARPCD